MGQMLQEMPKQKPGEHWKEKRFHGETVTPPYKRNKGDDREHTLPVTKTEANRYQQIASLPDEKFEQIIAETKEADRYIWRTDCPPESKSTPLTTNIYVLPRQGIKIYQFLAKGYKNIERSQRDIHLFVPL